METTIDLAQRAIPDLAIILPVVDNHDRRVELKAFDNGEIHIVLVQIGGALALVPGEPRGLSSELNVATI
jgi:hypothetical protein